MQSSCLLCYSSPFTSLLEFTFSTKAWTQRCSEISLHRRPNLPTIYTLYSNYFRGGVYLLLPINLSSNLLQILVQYSISLQKIALYLYDQFLAVLRAFRMSKVHLSSLNCLSDNCRTENKQSFVNPKSHFLVCFLEFARNYMRIGRKPEAP